MQFFTTTAAILAVALPLTSAGDAPSTTGNSPTSQYLATLPANPYGTVGTIKIGAGDGGNGVLVQVSMSNLPSYGGDFLYHVHKDPIINGNCSSAGGHLDPYGNGGSGCDISNPASCEVGDLSGKHGKINGTSFSANYVDDYLSLDNGDAAVKGRSIVVHFGNKTAITCANLDSITDLTTTIVLPGMATDTASSSGVIIASITDEMATTMARATTLAQQTASAYETTTTVAAGGSGALGAGLAAGVVGLAAFLL